MYIKPFSELSKGDAAIAGGKGASLGEMTNAGVPVPPGFVVLSDAFEKFLEETDLNVEIDSILHGVDTKAMHTIEHASETIQKLILEARMPEDIAREILDNFKKLDARFVAVRSSATAEDSASAAWAGQLDSFLNTTEESLLKNVQRCWASLFTPRAIFYRFEQGLHESKISVAVVVQKMVESEVSGIAFSVHPVTEDYNQLIIEAGFGLGEAIVSGQITPDSYVVEKEPRRIVDVNVSEQERGIYRKSSNGENEWQSIPVEKRNQQKLSNEQTLELSEIIVGIERHYGFPCDIEWAFEGNKFYIVQSRPITTLTPLVVSLAPDVLKSEDYTYVGYYKCSIFANWFWTAWYSDELARKIDLKIDFGGYTGYAGGHSSLHKQTIQQLGDVLHAKIKKGDLRYFDEIVVLADDEFASAMRFADSIQIEKDTIQGTFEEVVTHARRMMFFWWIGWQFSEIFDETLKNEAMKLGISEGDISASISQPDTPLIRQQAEVKKLKGVLEERGIWELLKRDVASAIEKITESPDLNVQFKNHIEKYEWIQMINWVGDKLTLEKLLEQMTYLKTEEEKIKMVIPDSFKPYADVASRISYIRQAGAEYSSMFENKALPVLEALAKEEGVSVRDMLNLLPEEFFSGPNLSRDIAEKIEKRKKDKWFIYVDRDNSIKSIEDTDTADTLAKSFIPIAEEGNSNELRGNIGNKGKAIGPVRVILATDDFHKMQEGDVLVTPMTTPDFVLLMQKSSAIVTDMGGLLCHAAIVSRELNKPCIIGTNFGTQVLHDGDLVEVDADNGVVRILERAKSTEADAMEEYSKVPIKENTEVSYEEFSAMYLKNGWVKIGNWKIPTISLDPFFCSQSTYYLSLYGITDVPPLKYLQVGADVYISKKELDAIRQKIFAKLESEDSTFLSDLDTNLTKARNELAESLDTLEHTKEVSHDVLREVLKHLCAVLVMFEVTRDLSNYLEERISKRFEELLVSPIPLPELLEQDTETDIYKLDSEICALKKNGYVKEDLTRLVAQFGYLKQYYLAGVGYTEADFEKMIQESEAEKMHTEHKTPPITDAKLHELIQIMNRFAIVRLLNNEAGNKAMYALRPVFKQVAIDSGMSYGVLISLHLEEFLRVLRRESAMIDPLGAMNTALISGDKNYILAKGSLERFKKEYFSEDLQGIKELRGTTTYGGIVRGIVRIISGDSDFPKFEEGDVLVCSMTDPNLVPLMKVASAFVTDMGGILCHAAILSRELKKPCIIGTKIATQVLHDGDLVEVDADNGVVRILKKTNDEKKNNDPTGGLWEKIWERGLKVQKAIDYSKAIGKPFENIFGKGLYLWLYTFDAGGASAIYGKKDEWDRFTMYYLDAFEKDGAFLKLTLHYEDYYQPHLTFLKKISDKNLKKFDNQELSEFFIRYKKSVIDYFAPIWFVVALESVIEKSVVRLLEKRFTSAAIEKNALRILSSTEHNYLSSEEVELSQISLLSGNKRDKALQKHASKYAYIPMYDYDHAPYTLEYFQEKLEKLDLIEIQKKQKKLDNNKKEFDELLHSGEFSEYEKKQMRSLHKLFNDKDQRSHFRALDSFWGAKIYTEIACRTNHSVGDLQLLTDDEILSCLAGADDFVDQKIKQRAQKNILLYENGTYTILTGREADEYMERYAQRQSGTEIMGLGVSGGKVSGKVKIIKTTGELSTLCSGNILVTSMTRPEYVQMMKQCAGIVTDEGSLLCHAAIVSRELHLPCVVGTKIATQVLHDGDLVEVDADNGVVRILERAA